MERPGESFAVDSAEDHAFRARVRAWLEENVPRDLCNRAWRIEPDELKPWHRLLYEKGWIAPHWPKEYGGMGASLTRQIILYEEMARLGAPTPYPHGLNFLGPTLIEAGTEAQKARHLPPILTGEATWCQGYSEPNAGSDLASLKMRAELVGDEFILNGQKIWTTNGHYADWMFALVRSDAGAKPKQAGITFLLIDLKSPGITIRPIRSIIGDAEFAEEFFDDVRVPIENMVGELHQGWRVANLVLGNERFATGHPRNATEMLSIAARVAAATGAMEEAGFRDRLNRLSVEATAFAAFYRHGAALHGAGRTSKSMAAVIKIVGGELAQRAAGLVNEAAGSYGPAAGEIDTPDGPLNVSAMMFESRRLTVGSGTVEIQRNILAKRVLDLPS